MLYGAEKTEASLLCSFSDVDELMYCCRPTLPCTEFPYGAMERQSHRSSSQHGLARGSHLHRPVRAEADAMMRVELVQPIIQVAANVACY